jgi:hypothetical protein
MQQLKLIHDSFLDALGEVVRALGGIKVVGPRMRETKSREAAITWLKDCLNTDRREKFDLEDVQWLLREGRKIGCDTGLHFLCEDAGYTPAQPIEPQDEAAELQRMFIESVRTQQKTLERLGQLGVVPLKAVA